MSRPAPAKLNLHLRVFPPERGFHPLRSWFRTVALHDDLERIPGPPGVECDDPAVPTDGTNLALRAAAELGVAARFRLTKRIPAGCGMGGGSSDAAAALALLGGGTVEQAARLGSDVPFFHSHQQGGTTDATCTGRGEVVAPFAPARRHAALLILPGVPCPTPAVFRAFDALPPPPDDGTPDFAGWSALPAGELLPRLRNDLEPAAASLFPDLGRLRDDCERRLGRPVRMTGSGSTLFTLYDAPDEAQTAAVRLPVRAIVG